MAEGTGQERWAARGGMRWAQGKSDGTATPTIWTYQRVKAPEQLEINTLLEVVHQTQHSYKTIANSSSHPPSRQTIHTIEELLPRA
jgi:hypothetical protein